MLCVVPRCTYTNAQIFCLAAARKRNPEYGEPELLFIALRANGVAVGSRQHGGSLRGPTQHVHGGGHGTFRGQFYTPLTGGASAAAIQWVLKLNANIFLFSLDLLRILSILKSGNW